MLSAGIVGAGSETLVRPSRVAGKILTHFRYLASTNTTSGLRFVQIRDNSGDIGTDTEACMGNCSNPFIVVGGNLYYILQCAVQAGSTEVLTIQASATGLPALTKNSTFTKLETFGSSSNEAVGSLRERNFNDYDASSNPSGVYSFTGNSDGSQPATYVYGWAANFGDSNFKTIFPLTSSTEQSAGITSQEHYVLRLT